MSEPPLPLVIDLDGTLVHTDTLLEQLVLVAFKAPGRAPSMLFALLKGRAAFKRAVAQAAQLDVRTLPYDEALLTFAADRKSAGASVHLVTAADQSIADGVAAHVGVFETAQGSDGRTNLKGSTKAAAVAERFRDGFAYVGDSGADLPVWRKAREVLVMGGGSGLYGRLAREGLGPHHAFAWPSGGLRDWLTALRVHQWSKNAVLLVPLVLSQQFLNPEILLRAAIGLVLFNLVASATYLINDLSDLAADRAHPTKRQRPLAAGKIHIRTAAPTALLLLLGGLAGTLLLHPAFGLVSLGYVVTTLFYSFTLKAQPLIDTMTIGGLFTVRVIAGMVLVDSPVSPWLGAFTFMLFTSLALAKRNGELVRAQQAGRPVVGRGYLAGDALLTTSLGLATGVTAVLLMVLYMELEARMTGLYANVGPLFMISVVLAAWILRVWLRAHRGELQDDPVVFALKDRTSWFHAGAVALLWLAAVRPIL